MAEVSQPVKSSGITTKSILVILVIILSCICFVIFGKTAEIIYNLPLGNTNYNNSIDRNTNVNTNTNRQPTKPVGPKEGDVISGPGRQEIENKYNSEKKLSELKAQNYANSLSGTPVVWIARVDSVKEEFWGKGYEVGAYMNGYHITIQDPGKKFGDLNEGQLIKVSGKIDKLDDFIGIDVDIVDALIEEL